MKKLAITICAVFSICSVGYSQAKLIVYRPASAYGSLANYKVMVDNKEVTTLKSKSMYETNLTPGRHTVSPKQMGRAITLDAKAGETYVVEYKTPIHILGAKAKLKSMSLADAQQDSRYKNVMAKNKSMM